MQEEEIAGWIRARLPGDWFAGPAEVEVDNDEILVIGRLAEPAAVSKRADVPRTAWLARVRQFREESRERRMRLAQDAERRFGRKVAWGLDSGNDRVLFTTLSVPVMTRLRMPERKVLDTLVQAGVARSRSDALAWCVRLVGKHQGDWIRDLQEALVRVNELRRAGPA